MTLDAHRGTIPTASLCKEPQPLECNAVSTTGNQPVHTAGLVRTTGDAATTTAQTLKRRQPSPSATTREMLTVAEVAAMLSIGVRSVWRKSQDGRLPPPIKMTGSTRWAKSTIQDWLAEKASAAQKQSRAWHRP